MPAADVLTWPVADCRLVDHIDLLIPLASVDEAGAEKLARTQHVIGLVEAMRLYDPTIRGIECSVVATAAVPALGAVTSRPFTLQVSVRYPELLSVVEVRRRKFLLLRALMSMT
jgi:hypothetical protein